MREKLGNNQIAAGLVYNDFNSAFLGTSDTGGSVLEEVSPLRHVSENTPPTFIWATASDELVDVQHSIRMAHALADKKVPFELHIYEEGAHGLSLGNQTTSEAQTQINKEVQNWIEEAEKWLQKRFAYDLPEMTEMEKMMQSFAQMKKNHVVISSKNFIRIQELYQMCTGYKLRKMSIWNCCR